MRLLIVASTPFEIAPLIAYLEGGSFEQVQSSRFRKGNHEVHLLVSGVGIALTTYHLTRALRDQVYDLVIQAGIAGSFDRSIPLGEVVQVVSEQFADLGVEEADGSFTDVFSLGLLDRNFPPFENGKLLHPVAESIAGIRAVRGLTLDRVHGFPPSIESFSERNEGEIETMEGAPFFMCCLLEKRNFLAFRAISNYVEARNREAWDLGGAIGSLNKFIIELIDSILE